MTNSVASAQALMKAGKADEALAMLKELLAGKPDLLVAHMLSAAALIRLQRPQESLVHLDTCAKAVDEAPNPVRARSTLAMHYSNAGEFDRAAKLLEEAKALEPDSHEITARRADLHGKQGQWAEALALYKDILRDLPGHSAVEASAGIAAQQLGELEIAVKHYQAALKGDERQVFVYNNLLAALVELGKLEEAYQHSANWHQRTPDDIEAMAFHSLLAVETGDERVANVWFDFNKVVKPVHVEVPAGYGNLSEFNRALEAHILDYPELKTPPVDHPTWHHPALRIGSQINSGDATGPVADLEQLMHRAVDDYLAGTNGDTHPFFAQRPARYSIHAWAAVLDKQGNQLPHIHKSGYLSGCYYVTIPKEISTAQAEPDGAIAGGFEMGRPPVELAMKAQFPVQTIRPQEGLMVLFPAYLYHGTVPFKSDQRRICIAFDVIPER